jgi:MYXO-CTERM domain-containing protein
VGGGDPNVNGGGGTSVGGGGGSSGNSGVRRHGFLGMSDSGCSVGAVGSTPAEDLGALAVVGLGLAVAASRRRR